jgi:hypothetical protein
MFWVVAALVFVFLAIFIKPILSLFSETSGTSFKAYIGRGICIILAFLCFAHTSIVFVKDGHFLAVTRVYMGNDMAAGQIIAAPWQKGPQAWIIPPGFHFIPFFTVVYDDLNVPELNVPSGHYVILTAKDGKVLPQGEFVAPEWEDTKMIDAIHFLGFDTGEKTYKGPRGTKGPQLTVLTPGNFRINPYLFQVSPAKPAKIVNAGFVGVVKSNVGPEYSGPTILPPDSTAVYLSSPVVPKGYRGIWKEVLIPGAYYMNEVAYTITDIDTRMQTWEYIGGFKQRWIDLKVDDAGNIVQTERVIDIPPLPQAADMAILLRVENWDIFLDSRIQVQVAPTNAPFIVASVGGIKEVEDKVITPMYRAILRNIISRNTVETIEEKGVKKEIVRQRKALDLLYQRAQIESEVEKELIPQGMKVGITISQVLFGDPAVPPELLIPGKRQQLASQLMDTYRQEKIAQGERVNSENEKARANQQSELVKSQIGIQVADNNAAARKKSGEGEEAYMKAVARGQEAQANILGKDKAYELAYIKVIMDTIKEHPDIIKMPNTLVMGENSGFTGAAAILGGSNIGLGLKETPAPQLKTK